MSLFKFDFSEFRLFDIFKCMRRSHFWFTILLQKKTVKKCFVWQSKIPVQNLFFFKLLIRTGSYIWGFEGFDQRLPSIWRLHSNQAFQLSQGPWKITIDLFLMFSSFDELVWNWKFWLPNEAFFDSFFECQTGCHSFKIFIRFHQLPF